MARYGSGAGSPLISGANTLATPSSYSYAFWYRNTTAFGATYKIPVELFNANFDVGFAWGHASAGFRHAAFHQKSNSTYIAAQTSTALSTNTWYALGAVWDGANLGAFVNGAREVNPACSTVKGTLPTLSLLGRAGGGTSDITGTIAEFAYWHNVALTTAEMAALATGASPFAVHPDGLTVYWPLWGDSPEPDYSGNRNSGTVTTATIQNHPPVAAGLA